MSTVVSVRQSGTTIFSQPRRAAGGSCGARHVRGLGVAAAARPLARSFDASDCAPTDRWGVASSSDVVSRLVSPGDVARSTTPATTTTPPRAAGSTTETRRKRRRRQKNRWRCDATRQRACHDSSSLASSTADACGSDGARACAARGASGGGARACASARAAPDDARAMSHSNLETKWPIRIGSLHN